MFWFCCRRNGMSFCPVIKICQPIFGMWPEFLHHPRYQLMNSIIKIQKQKNVKPRLCKTSFTFHFTGCSWKQRTETACRFLFFFSLPQAKTRETWRWRQSSGVRRLFEGQGRKEGHFSAHFGSQEGTLAHIMAPRRAL